MRPGRAGTGRLSIKEEHQPISNALRTLVDAPSPQRCATAHYNPPVRDGGEGGTMPRQMLRLSWAALPCMHTHTVRRETGTHRLMLLPVCSLRGSQGARCWQISRHSSEGLRPERLPERLPAPSLPGRRRILSDARRDSHASASFVLDEAQVHNESEHVPRHTPAAAWCIWCARQASASVFAKFLAASMVSSGVETVCEMFPGASEMPISTLITYKDTVFDKIRVTTVCLPCARATASTVTKTLKLFWTVIW